MSDDLEKIVDALTDEQIIAYTSLLPNPIKFHENYHEYLRATYPNPRWSPDYPHVELISKYCQQLIDGDIHRLRLSYPPRHGKSENFTIRLAAYWMEHFPDQNVLIGGYNQGFADRFSRKAQEIFVARGGKLNPKRTAAEEWQTFAGGTCLARGVFNPPTGIGIDLCIIDDCLRKTDDASNENHREKLWQWYAVDICQRLQPDARLALVGTCWHYDDLLQRAPKSEPGDWTIINVPALAEPDKDHPDPLGRAEGEPLWPEVWDKQRLLQRKNQICQIEGDYWWDAIYQQRPAPKDGSFFKIKKINDCTPDALPKFVTKCRAWDFAYTKNQRSDYTAGVLMGITGDRRFYVLDVIHEKLSSDELVAKVRDTAIADGRDTHIHIPQDPAGGVFVSQTLTRVLAGFNVKVDPPVKKKEIRAQPFSAQLNAGNVWVMKDMHWTNEFVNELRTFPNCRHEDQVDAVSDSFSYLVNKRPSLYVL